MMRHTLGRFGACKACREPYPWASDTCLANVTHSKFHGFSESAYGRECETRAALGTTPLTLREWSDRVLAESK